MNREEQKKLKELKIALMKIAKPKLKPYGFKTKDYLIWFVQNDFFFTMLLCVNDLDNDCWFSYRINAKPLYADDMLWNILDMKDNKKEPLSLRAIGAFSLFGVPVLETRTKISKLEISELERLVEHSISTFSNLLSSICGAEEVWFLQENKNHNEYYQSDSLRLMILLHNEKYIEALDFISKSNGRTGVFSNDGKNLVERVIDYCQRRVLE